MGLHCGRTLEADKLPGIDCNPTLDETRARVCQSTRSKVANLKSMHHCLGVCVWIQIFATCAFRRKATYCPLPLPRGELSPFVLCIFISSSVFGRKRVDRSHCPCIYIGLTIILFPVAEPSLRSRSTHALLGSNTTTRSTLLLSSSTNQYYSHTYRVLW